MQFSFLEQLVFILTVIYCKSVLYKNKDCVLPIVPWENEKRKGEKTIQNLHFFAIVKLSKQEQKVKKWQIL